MTIHDHDGFDADALRRLVSAVESDIANDQYDGAVLLVTRDGRPAVEAAIGVADRETGRPIELGDVFSIFSLTKAFVNALVLRAIDHGLLTLQTRVVDVIPEFWGRDPYRSARKDRVNVGHLLTHRAGLPSTPMPLPYEELPDLAATIAAICELDVVAEPGASLNYSPTVNHALLGEIVRRVSGLGSLRELLRRDVFDPLGMKSTSLGMVSDLRGRAVPVISRYPEGGWLSNEDVQRVARAITADDSEMPWVGGVASAPDILRFAEALRRGGELDGYRLVSPAVLDKATTLQTGDALNDLYRLLAEPRGWEVPPGNFGLGFALGGAGLTVSQFGSLSSPRTFGNFGAGSTLFWVDPERQISFVCLTARVIEESDNILRFQRLSDLTLAAAR